MNIRRSVGACLVWAGLVALPAIPEGVSAQAPPVRTWVSVRGDDAGPCSRSLPCKTFQGAIAKTAAAGEINCVDSGDFGIMEITKSILIDCKGVLAGVLNAGTYGIIIDAFAGQVTLRHLDLNGKGTGQVGIRILNASNVQLEDVSVRGNTRSGIEVVPTRVTQMHAAFVRVVSRDNGQHGVLVAPVPACTCPASVAVSESVFSGNGLTGIRVNDFGTAVIADSILTGNGTHGAAAVAAGNVGAFISLESVTSASNLNGGVLASGAYAGLWLSNVVLTGNAYGLYPAIGGAGYFTFGNNRSVGNTILDLPGGLIVNSQF